MQTRADFLATGALAALAGTPPPKPSASPSYPPLAFDLAAFDAILQTPAAHRHLFAAQRLNGGQVLETMQAVIDAYTSTGADASTVKPVAVLYHGVSLLVALDDVAWNRYVIPYPAKDFKGAKEMAGDVASIYQAGGKGNPCYHRTGKDDDISVERLVLERAHFFVCNRALQGVSGMFARASKRNKVEVYNELSAHLVPGATLVPAGIWAVHAIQERKYTYMQVNLQP